MTKTEVIADLMTHAQGGACADLGRQQGVTVPQCQQVLDDGRMAEIMRSIAAGTLPGRLGLAVACGNIRAPEGGRIHLVVPTPVQLDPEWSASLEAAGPQTPGDFNVRKVGDQYQPTGTGMVSVELLLLNWPGHGLAEHLAWAKEYPILTGTDPRRVFGVAEKHPQLHRNLGMDPAYVIATQECAFEGRQQLCRVWFSGEEREAGLYWTFSVGDDFDWVAFSGK